MSRIQVPTEKETLEFLSYASSINNLWSAFNNFNQNNSDETYRSFQLMYSDIVGILKEYTESPAFKSHFLFDIVGHPKYNQRYFAFHYSLEWYRKTTKLYLVLFILLSQTILFFMFLFKE